MKKLELNVVALILFANTVFVSCSNDDDGNKVVVKKAFVTAVTGPTSATLNQEISLDVTFSVDNKCGIFTKFTETAVGIVKTIETEVKYERNDCGTTPTTKKAIYKFKNAADGTYSLKFKKSATEFIRQTIVVSPAS